MRITIVAGLAPAVLLASVGLAQQDTVRPRDQQTPARPAERQHPGAMEHRRDQGQKQDIAFYVKGKNLLGAKVVNAQQEDLGTIDDLLIDARSGYALYGVLSHGGFLGIGDKLIAVPWRALEVLPNSDGDATVMLPASKQSLEQAPNFDKDQWPLIGERRWMARAHEFFKTEPSPSAGATGGWGRQSVITREWQQGRDRELRGQVTRIERESPRRGISEGVVVTVRPDDGREQTIILGPDWFIHGQPVQLKEGETIALQVREIKVGDDTLIVAREVTLPDRSRLVLRQRTGEPVWDTSAVVEDGEVRGEARVAAAGESYIRATELRGKNVQGAREDDKLADVDELAIDPNTGKVKFLILGVGGLAGLGDRDVVVPWEACRFIEQGDKMAMGTDEATLRSAPALEEGGFPMVNKPEFRQRVMAFFSTPAGRMYATPEPRPAQPPVMHEGDNSRGWAAGSEYNRLYTGQAVTVTGTVKDVTAASPMQGMSDAVALTVDSPEGAKHIHVGPRWFVAHQDLRFRQGDRVTIKGVKAKVGSDEVILAQQITTSGRTIHLRDEQGRPHWDASRRELDIQERMPNDRNREPGRDQPVRDPGRPGGPGGG